jgi:hypothetical protein
LPLAPREQSGAARPGAEMRAGRDEYRWVRDLTAGQPAVRAKLPTRRKPRTINLLHWIGVTLSLLAVALVVSGWF